MNKNIRKEWINYNRFITRRDYVTMLVRTHRLQFILEATAVEHQRVEATPHRRLDRSSTSRDITVIWYVYTLYVL